MNLIPYTIDTDRLSHIQTLYKNFRTDPISYATVRDFSDSVLNLPEIATIAKDLKDVQRSWILKAIIGSVPSGGKIIEIGAGDPHVAHWLSQLGYQIVVVDPYDGSGNGPTNYEYYRENFPSVQFVKENFSDEVNDLIENSYDCIYSISVLEHIPHPSLKKVMAGIQRYKKLGANTHHAVDHVLKGNGSEHHLKTLEIIGEELGINNYDLHTALQNAADDVDTYFLSAEAHNMWRGNISYEEFPMRRCISMHFSK
jgi:uncharacterized UPF0146 family protein